MKTTLFFLKSLIQNRGFLRQCKTRGTSISGAQALMQKLLCMSDLKLDTNPYVLKPSPFLLQAFFIISINFWMRADLLLLRLLNYIGT